MGALRQRQAGNPGGFEPQNTVLDMLASPLPGKSKHSIPGRQSAIFCESPGICSRCAIARLPSRCRDCVHNAHYTSRVDLRHGTPATGCRGQGVPVARTGCRCGAQVACSEPVAARPCTPRRCVYLGRPWPTSWARPALSWCETGPGVSSTRVVV